MYEEAESVPPFSYPGRRKVQVCLSVCLLSSPPRPPPSPSLAILFLLAYRRVYQFTLLSVPQCLAPALLLVDSVEPRLALVVQIDDPPLVRVAETRQTEQTTLILRRSANRISAHVLGTRKADSYVGLHENESDLVEVGSEGVHARRVGQVFVGKTGENETKLTLVVRASVRTDTSTDAAPNTYIREREDKAPLYTTTAHPLDLLACPRYHHTTTPRHTGAAPHMVYLYVSTYVSSQGIFAASCVPPTIT